MLTEVVDRMVARSPNYNKTGVGPLNKLAPNNLPFHVRQLAEKTAKWNGLIWVHKAILPRLLVETLHHDDALQTAILFVEFLRVNGLAFKKVEIIKADTGRCKVIFHKIEKM